MKMMRTQRLLVKWEDRMFLVVVAMEGEVVVVVVVVVVA